MYFFLFFFLSEIHKVVYSLSSLFALAQRLEYVLEIKLLLWDQLNPLGHAADEHIVIFSRFFLKDNWL